MHWAFFPLPGGGAMRKWRIWLAAGAAVAVLAPAAVALAGQLDTVAAAPAVAPTAFKHPGVLDSRPGLDFVRAKVIAGAQPWKGAFDRMNKDGLASMTRRAKPRATVE